MELSEALFNKHKMQKHNKQPLGSKYFKLESVDEN
jgi:hypothetical protein